MKLFLILLILLSVEIFANDGHAMRNEPSAFGLALGVSYQAQTPMYGFDVIFEREKNRPVLMLSVKSNLNFEQFHSENLKYSGTFETTETSMASITVSYVHNLFSGLNIYGGMGMSAVQNFMEVDTTTVLIPEEKDPKYSIKYVAGAIIYLNTSVYFIGGYETNPESVSFGFGFHR